MGAWAFHHVGWVVFVGLVLVLVRRVLRWRRRRHRHSLLYRWYIGRSHLWKFRRWLCWTLAFHRCGGLRPGRGCGKRLALHTTRRREGMQCHHAKGYKHLGYELPGELTALCGACHRRADAWRHRR